jgi:hypothetical protein
MLEVCYPSCAGGATQQQAVLATLCAQLRCPNGAPGLWLGEAKAQQGGAVGIAAVLCRPDQSPALAGQWACFPTTAGVNCVTTGGPLQGTIDETRVTLASDGLPGGVVSRCDFTGNLLSAGHLAGDYVCAGDTGRTGGSFVLAPACQQ